MNVMNGKGRPSSRKMPTNNIEDMTDCENLHFAIITGIID